MTNWIAAIEKYRCLGIALGQFSEDAPTQCTKLTNDGSHESVRRPAFLQFRYNAF